LQNKASGGIHSRSLGISRGQTRYGCRRNPDTDKSPAGQFFRGQSGNVTDEVIIKYIEQQNIESPDGDFKTEDDL